MILLKNLTSNYLAFDNPKENEKMYKYKDGNTTINYIINKSNNKILSIERTGKCFKKVIISIENDTSLSPKRIIIHHKNVNLKIDLKRLEKL